MTKSAARGRKNMYQFLTNSGRMWLLNPGAILSDQWVSRVNRKIAAANRPPGACHGDGKKSSSDMRPDDAGAGR
jgi:hypothetical protein